MINIYLTVITLFQCVVRFLQNNEIMSLISSISQKQDNINMEENERLQDHRHQHQHVRRQCIEMFMD